MAGHLYERAGRHGGKVCGQGSVLPEAVCGGAGHIGVAH